MLANGLDVYGQFGSIKKIPEPSEAIIYEITTNFFDHINDSIQLYIIGDNKTFKLTDDGFILNNLDFSENKREEIERVVKAYDLKIENGCEICYIDSIEICLNKNRLFYILSNFISAIISMECVAFR